MAEEFRDRGMQLERIEALEEENASLEGEKKTLNAERERLRVRIEALEDTGENRDPYVKRLAAQNQELEEELTKVREQLAAAEHKAATAVSRARASGELQLNPDVVKAFNMFSGKAGRPVLTFVIVAFVIGSLVGACLAGR